MVGPDEMRGIGMTSQRTRDRLVQRLRAQGIDRAEVLEQIARIPRHVFIDEALSHRAYEDTALPIGFGQTISQPFVVALMTQLLLDGPLQRVLEVGTGCGYQTAVLAGLCDRVWSIERIGELATRAKERLTALNIRNVALKVGDGYEGWAVNGPYDGILVAAAPAEIPKALLEQLAVGGRMVIPVGGDGVQELRFIERTPSGFEETVREAVRFVPLQPGVLPASTGMSGAMVSEKGSITHYHGRRDKPKPSGPKSRKVPLE